MATDLRLIGSNLKYERWRWQIFFITWLAYAAGQFCWGPLGDKLGTRKVIVWGMIASVLTAVLMGATSTAFFFGLLFAVQGICQSTGWAPLTKNIGEFFSQRERGRVMGFWCSNYALGGLVA